MNFLIVFLLFIGSLAGVFYVVFAWDAARYSAKRKQPKQEASLHVNYLYLLHWARLVNDSRPGAKILDYGCGSGKVVVAGRKLGLDVYGTDIFNESATVYKEEVEKSGLLGSVIREITNDRLGFDDEYFDVIVNNQVFEHVENLDLVLAETYRVMKKGSLLLCLFPSKEIIREGHIGIPFAHWFPKNSQLRYYCTLAFRSVGFGYVKDRKKPKSLWTKEALDWIDKYTVYRSRADIMRAFSRFFEINLMEHDYIRYRLSKMKHGKFFLRILDLPGLPQVSQVLFRKAAGLVILARKPLMP